MIKSTNAAGLAALLLLGFACEQNDMHDRTELSDLPIYANLPSLSNARLGNSNYAVYSAEYLTPAESGQVGNTIFFNDRGNKQLSADFVPGLSLDGSDNVSYYVDQTRPSADLPAAVTSQAIDRAMATWENVKCSDLGLTKISSSLSISSGFISAILGFGGSTDYVADLVHAGWLPAPFFDALAEGGSTFILGVTFTIIFTDDDGNPVDTNNDGKIDVAWREIYYNDAFTWRDGGHYDVETIALHEAGHGLSQGHFGKAFLDNGKGKVHFAPRAVMNAAYSGIQRTINGTDNGGHCSIWANWPNN
jgi:hypothetical protein